MYNNYLTTDGTCVVVMMVLHSVTGNISGHSEAAMEARDSWDISLIWSISEKWTFLGLTLPSSDSESVSSISTLGFLSRDFSGVDLATGRLIYYAKYYGPDRWVVWVFLCFFGGSSSVFFLISYIFQGFLLIFKFFILSI